MKNSKIVGVFLAVFFGTFGFHQAYVGNFKLSFIYAFFSFTGIPTVLGLLEAFFMPQRVENNKTDVSLGNFVLYPLGGLFTAFVLVMVIVGGFKVIQGGERAEVQPEKQEHSQKLIHYLEDQVNPDRSTSVVDRQEFKILKNFLNTIDKEKMDASDIFHHRVRESSDWPEVKNGFSKFRQKLRNVSSLELIKKDVRTPGEDSDSNNILAPKFDTDSVSVNDPQVTVSKKLTFTLESDESTFEFELLEINDDLYLGSSKLNGNDIYKFNKENYFY